MMTVTTSDVLEVLYRARANLSNDAMPYHYSDYGQCTAGHIYGAAVGELCSRGEVVRGRDELARDTMIAVARALNGDLLSYRQARHFVSRRTLTLASQISPRFVSNALRDAALRIVEDAIGTLEAQHEADRLEVLARVRSIVDAVPVAEEVPA